MSGGAVSAGAGGSNKIRPIGIFIWSIAACFFLYEFFLRTFFGSLEPQIIKSLHLNAETFSVLGSCYYLTYGLMQIPVGIIIDRFGVKATMVVATALCGTSALLFAAADSFTMGLASRLLMGFGSSFAFIALLVIAREWFPKKNFGLFAGLSQFIGTLGPILAGGPLVLLLTRGHVDWRTIITALGLFGFVITIMSLLFVRGRKPDNPDALRLLPAKLGVWASVRLLLRNRQAWFVALYSALIYTSIATLGAIWGTRVLIAKGLTQETAGDAISILWIGYTFGYLTGCDIPQIL